MKTRKPLVAPSYNHSAAETAFIAIVGALSIVGLIGIIVLAACGVI